MCLEMGIGGVEMLNPHCWFSEREVEALPLGSDVSRDHSSLPAGAGVALLQGFWCVVLCLLLVFRA